MMNVEVQAQESFERIHTILQGIPGGVEKAMKDVMSRATITARKTSLEAVTSVYNISMGDVRNRKNSTITMNTKQSESGIVGEIKYSSYKIPLYRFGVKPKNPTPRKNQDVTANVIRSGPTTLLKNAFVAETKSGHLGVFERKPGDYQDRPGKSGRVRANRSGHSKHAERIGYKNHDQFYGQSTAQMVASPDVFKRIETEAVQETIVKRTEQQITSILNGHR